MTLSEALSHGGAPSHLPQVLIADDDPSVLATLQNAFAQLMILPAAASDGIDAWQMICNARPDIVIVNWMLPRMDGYRICRDLREEGLAMSVLMIGKDILHDIWRKMPLPADYVLCKPFEVDLVDQLVRLVAFWRARRPGTLGPPDVPKRSPREHYN